MHLDMANRIWNEKFCFINWQSHWGQLKKVDGLGREGKAQQQQQKRQKTVCVGSFPRANEEPAGAVRLSQTYVSWVSCLCSKFQI